SVNALTAATPNGGAIYGSSGSTTTVINSTISGNSANEGAGGGIGSLGTVVLDNATIVDNQANTGGAVDVRNAMLEMTSSILANSIPSAGSIRDLLINSGSTISVNNSNLIETCGSALSCSSFTFAVTEDPQLKPLADNGGATLTHLPCTTSPVIDAGASTSNSASADQRGEMSPVNSNGQPDATDGTDIGAVELQPVELPVELLDFYGVTTKAGVLLKWQTASEWNNKGFEIEQSMNAKHWRRVGFVPGKGTTLVTQSYSWTDAQAKEGQNYYRLKQVDFDGTHDFSEIKNIWVGQATKDAQLVLFPNPVEEILYVQLSDAALTETSLVFQLHNSHGQLVKTWIEEGNDSNTLSMKGVSKGLYTLSTYAGHHYLSRRVFKQ
ncbi:MAG: choice-of-anchor Q domain-containing protein, partial [Bacteroidota bacterium]